MEYPVEKYVLMRVILVKSESMAQHGGYRHLLNVLVVSKKYKVSEKSDTFSIL